MTMTEDNQHTIAGSLSGCLRRVDELWLTCRLRGASATRLTVSATDPIDGGIDGALGIANVCIGDTSIWRDVGLDIVKGRGSRDGVDGDDDEGAQQGEELHLGNEK